MEVVRERRICREKLSPERAKMFVQTRVMKPVFKKVQVVYYLSRNGQLEHPHYMEVTHLAHQQLRLKDVLDRLTVLRGKGMPSIYSWSCKRSYKNGYVWNDLAENDVIYPSEGAEYVLKGSEIVDTCAGKFQHLQVGNVQQLQIGNNQKAGQATNLHPKRKCLASKRQALVNSQYYPDEDQENAEEDEEKREAEQEYEEKISYPRCSRGVSTDEIEEFKQQDLQKSTPTELNLDCSNSFSSPPSATSSNRSDNTTTTEITTNNLHNKDNNTRLEDGDPVGTEPMLSLNSMLFSLIACGGSGSFRKTVPPVIKQSPPPCTAARKSSSGGNLHKGVVCKAAAKVAVEEDEMISYMSENPRFGNLQSEEKEYFSGSIVESMNTDERLGAEPALKKSSSYNDERSTNAGLGETTEEDEKINKGLKGKCIPRKKSSSKQSKQ